MIAPELDRLAPEWEELAASTGAPPFLHPGWVLAWWNAFGSGRLEVVSARREGRLVAAVPVVHRRLRVLTSPTNWHTPEFGFLATDEDAERELATRLAGLRTARLDLSFLQPDSGLTACIEAAQDRKLSVLVRPIQQSPYADFGGSFDDYLAGIAPSELSKMRRRRRQLEQVGRVEFSFEDGTNRFQELLAELFRVEASGWKGREGTAIVSDPTTTRFYTDVAEWAARRGVLRLAFLRLDGVAIAAQLDLEQDGVSWFLKTGYDERYGRFAPGLVLLFERLGDAYRAGVRRYELTGTSDSYKMVWASGVREKSRVQLFSRGPGGAAHYAVFGAGRPIAKKALTIARDLRRARSSSPG